jgi:transposase-like protein
MPYGGLHLRRNTWWWLFFYKLSCPEMSLRKVNEMEKIIIEERRHYPEAFKHSVVKEYLAGGIGYRALLKKYDIRTSGSIARWKRQLGYAEVPLKDRYLPSVKSLSLSSKKTNKDQLSNALSQEQRIKELERLLEDEQLRSEAYRRMIEIAEKDLNIPIRKKSGTK